MVDVPHIEQLLLEHFIIRGTHMVDTHTGIVDITGDVEVKFGKFEQFPVQFGKVTGSFDCRVTRINSLQGAPHTVLQDFRCTDNHNLKSLAGAPSHVGENFFCYDNRSLKSLDGIPDHVGLACVISWNSHLPLLRLLLYKDMHLWDAPDSVTQIIAKYEGQGKRVMLHCALELKNAGFDGNAKW